MVPIKAKNLIAPLAKECGIPEEHAKKMISHYFKENRILLENLEYLHITLRGLGIMTIKGWDIQKEIDRLTMKIHSSRAENTRLEYTQEREVYKRVKVKWDRQETKKKAVKQERKIYYDNKESNESERETPTGMEE